MSHAFTQLELLRHGQLATDGLFCAKHDEPLSEQGMQALIQSTKDGQWDIIISSPFVRCLAFAKELAKQTKTPLLIEDSFREMDFGDWTNKATKTLWKEDKAQFEKLWTDAENFTAHNGESMLAFSARVQKGLKIMLKKYKNQSILLITHAGVIRTILATALEMSYQSALKIEVGYASLTQLHHYPDGNFSLIKMGAQ